MQHMGSSWFINWVRETEKLPDLINHEISQNGIQTPKLDEVALKAQSFIRTVQVQELD